MAFQSIMESLNLYDSEYVFENHDERNTAVSATSSILELTAAVMY